MLQLMLLPLVALSVAGQWHFPVESTVSVKGRSETHVVKGGTHHFSWKCYDTARWEIYVPNTFRPELAVQVYQHNGPWEHMTATLRLSDVHPNTSATIVPCPYQSGVEPHLAVGLSAIAKYGPQTCVPGTTLELHISAEGPYLIHFGRSAFSWDFTQAASNYLMVGNWANIRSPLLSFVGTVAIVYALRAHTLLQSAEKSDWELITETIIVLLWFAALTTDMARYGEAVTMPTCTPSYNFAPATDRTSFGGCSLCTFVLRIAFGALGMAIPLWGRRGDWSKMIATALVIPAIFLGVGYIVVPILTIVWVNMFPSAPLNPITTAPKYTPRGTQHSQMLHALH